MHIVTGLTVVFCRTGDESHLCGTYSSSGVRIGVRVPNDKCSPFQRAYSEINTSASCQPHTTTADQTQFAKLCCSVPVVDILRSTSFPLSPQHASFVYRKCG